MGVIPILQKEPAVVAGAILAVLQALVLLGLVHLSVEQLAGLSAAMIAVLTLFVRQSSTSTAAPQLKQGTEVKVQGSTDTVVIQPSPPGPTGVEGGSN